MFRSNLVAKNDEYHAIAKEFNPESNCQFPNIVGALDDGHMRILCTKEEEKA